jgi:glutamate--cysteine ligase
LAASFANSPVARGVPTGWRSTRLGIWEGLDRTRTAPALRTGRACEDWTAYLLDANVMLIRDGGRYVPLHHPFPFGRWLAEGHELGWPDADDLAYHASTLFPPVRPRGYLELRCMDAIGSPWWAVPIAVTAALLDDPEAADGTARATGRASWCWCEAPRWSLEYEPLAEAAKTCFSLARDALPRLGAPASLLQVVEAYQERFVDRGLCPADQVLVT